MPEISRFFGIIVRMHYDDHRPPHVHAESRKQAKIDLSGDLPMRAEAGEGMDDLHPSELQRDWELLVRARLSSTAAPLE
jgi:Domain of unknown function (DUF4160)